MSESSGVMKNERATQLAVIGAGPGGYAAAFHASDLGMKVTLVDPEEAPGGVCLYRGCIPSKALLHAAALIKDASDAKGIGLGFGEPRIDLAILNRWKSGVIKRLTEGLARLTSLRGVEYLRGRARFIDSSTLEVVSGKEGSIHKVRYENAIVATGSKAASLPGASFGKVLMDSSRALELEEIPETLLVIGGGYIGLELGTVYAALGSRVSLVEMMPGLLPGVDRDLVRVLEKKLEGSFHRIFLETRVADLVEADGRARVTLERKDGSHIEDTFHRVLVAVGRKPDTSGLGIENTMAETSEKGYIKTSARLQTSDPAIYAIGDVRGEPMLAHKATHEGRTAVEAIAGSKAEFAPAAVPAVVFTEPEIAWCGLTEWEAREKGVMVDVERFPWSASGRARTISESEGVTKLLFEPSSGRILGAGIAGRGAGELIAEAVMAVEMGAVADDLDLAIHPHPTLSETLMECASLYMGKPVHIYRAKKKR